MIDTHVMLEAEIERLKSEVDHLRQCKEFESNLQRELLDIGSEFIAYPDGKTYSVYEVWLAIQKNLKQLEDSQKLYLRVGGMFSDSEGGVA